MMGRCGARLALVALPLVLACGSHKNDHVGLASSAVSGHTRERTVLLLLLENTNWSHVVGSPSAPFINGTMLTKGAHAESYFNPKGLHPSEPNYVWLEAGDNVNIKTNDAPAKNRCQAADHLVSLLEKSGGTWKSYQEDISGDECPISNDGRYAVRHNPVMFFDDVSDGVDRKARHCIEHVRPYSELAPDLANDTVPDYGFITPNLCDDGHDTCAPENDQVKQIDDFLAALVPKFMDSKAYERGSVLFVTWDEGSPIKAGEVSDGPIGMMVISKNAKAGYAGGLHYDHSSTLKTVEELLNLKPFLGHAAEPDVRDLSDLFSSFP